MVFLTVVSLNVFVLSGLLVLSFKKEIREFGLWMSLLIFCSSYLLYGSCEKGLRMGIPFFLQEKNLVWFDWFGFDFQIGLDFLSYYLLWLSVFLIPISTLCSWENIEKNHVKEFFCTN